MTIQLCPHCDRGRVHARVTSNHWPRIVIINPGLGPSIDGDRWIVWTRQTICRHCGGLGYVHVQDERRYMCWAGQGLPKWWADDGEGIGWPIRLVGQSDEVPPTFWAATSYLQGLLVDALEHAPAVMGSAITAFWSGFEKGVEHADKGQALEDE